MLVCLKFMASSATESGSSSEGVLHPILKLIALHLSWLNKGMMFWIKSQTSVNIIFKKSKVLILFVLVFLTAAFEQEKEPGKHKNGCTRSWKIHMERKKDFW